MTKKSKRRPAETITTMISPVYFASGGFAVAAVETSMARLRERYGGHGTAHEWYCDVHLGPVRPVVPRAYLSDYARLVGLAGGTWVLACIPWSPNPAAWLSRDFATRAASLAYEDTGDTLTYRLFDRGQQVEEYFHRLDGPAIGFESKWRPELRPGSDEYRFVDDTFRELGLRLPYAWLEPLTGDRLYGRAGFALDFSGERVRAERPVPATPLPRVPGELAPEEIDGFDMAIFSPQ